MRNLAILQARMSSTRFPGKVLADLEGKPMILRQLDRIKRSKMLDGVVVATSTNGSDDILAELLESQDIPYFRGELDDVLARFASVINKLQPETVVRLTADCPLTSPTVIDRVVRAFHANGADYVSNTIVPTYPDGLDVEVVKAEVLLELNDMSDDVAEREHVTLGIYRRPSHFKIANVKNERNYSNLRWTVDTPEDLEFVRHVYRALSADNFNFDFLEVLNHLEHHPELSRTSVSGIRNASLVGLDTGLMRQE